jgi:predicted alpha/beta hydrolase family esterase
MWARHLAAELRADGHVVIYPQFPNTDNPVLEEWQELLIDELEHLDEAGAGETIFIGHSLGCINWIQAAATGKIVNPVDRVLLVAPADPKLLDEVPGMNVDLTNADVAQSVLASARSLTVVGSDKDPWAPRGVQETFGDPLGLDAVIIPGAGHITLDEGWGRWQGVIDWVLDPTADLRVH